MTSEEEIYEEEHVLQSFRFLKYYLVKGLKLKR